MLVVQRLFPPKRTKLHEEYDYPDMGILLTFMFLWNMVGALVLIPALSYLLLNDRHMPAAARNTVKPELQGSETASAIPLPSA